MAKKISVCMTVDEKELEEFKAASHVDANAPAVLAMARIGLESQNKSANKSGKAGR